MKCESIKDFIREIVKPYKSMIITQETNATCSNLRQNAFFNYSDWYYYFWAKWPLKIANATKTVRSLVLYYIENKVF